jgi:hypothetical protein
VSPILDRPFVCARCQSAFSRQDALSRHEYTCTASLKSGAPAHRNYVTHASNQGIRKGNSQSSKKNLPQPTQELSFTDSQVNPQEEQDTYMEPLKIFV